MKPVQDVIKPLNMKTYFKYLPIVLLFVACKKDEMVVDNGSAGLNATSHAQFAVGNYWLYDGFTIDSITGDATPINIHDSIYIVKDTTISGALYHQFKGGHFGPESFYRNLRVDGARIVDENGRIYMDMNAQQDTVEIMPGWSVVDSAARVMHSGMAQLETPSGNFSSEFWQETLMYIQDPYPSPQKEEEYYVDGIGVAMYSAPFVSSAVVIEMRLSSYFVQ